MMKYSEKLKDPRWQKKRLEVMQRDEFTCQCCCDNTKPLHVHHLYYEKNKEPWEYDSDTLVTLCYECHEEETNERYNECHALLYALAEKRFLMGAISDIAIGFHEMNLVHPQEMFASALGWALQDEEMQDFIYKKYFEYLKNKKGKQNE